MHRKLIVLVCAGALFLFLTPSILTGLVLVAAALLAGGVLMDYVARVPGVNARAGRLLAYLRRRWNLHE